jgi:hypothetical protein
LSASPEAIARVVGLTCEFAELTGQELSPSKSFSFATSVADRKFLKASLSIAGRPLSRQMDFRDLGSHLSSFRVIRNATMAQRFEKARVVAARVGLLPLPFDARAALVSSAVIPAAVFGCEVTPVGQKKILSLRTSIMGAIWGPRRRFRCPEIDLTLFVKGHRVDPGQVFIKRSLMVLRSLA